MASTEWRDEWVSLADELRTLVAVPVDLVDALALMSLLYDCQIRLPSGATINAPDDEPFGREAAAQLLATVMDLPDFVALKVCFGERGAQYVTERAAYWGRKLFDVGVEIREW
jgi:hypothetical protein